MILLSLLLLGWFLITFGIAWAAYHRETERDRQTFDRVMQACEPPPWPMPQHKTPWKERRK